MAVHRISDAAEAALHRVAKTEGTNKLGDILSRLIIDYERGLQFHVGPGGLSNKEYPEVGQVYNPDGTPMLEWKA